MPASLHLTEVQAMKEQQITTVRKLLAGIAEKATQQMDSPHAGKILRDIELMARRALASVDRNSPAAQPSGGRGYGPVTDASVLAAQKLWPNGAIFYIVRLSDDNGFVIRFKVGVQDFGIDYNAADFDSARWYVEQLMVAMEKSGGHTTCLERAVDMSQVSERDET